MTDFVQRLTHLLEYFELSASSFSDTIGVQRSSLSHLLSGRNKPSLDLILKIHQHFSQVNLYWLLKGEEPFLNDGFTQEKSLLQPVQTPLTYSEVSREKQDHQEGLFSSEMHELSQPHTSEDKLQVTSYDSKDTQEAALDQTMHTNELSALRKQQDSEEEEKKEVDQRPNHELHDSTNPYNKPQAAPSQSLHPVKETHSNEEVTAAKAITEEQSTIKDSSLEVPTQRQSSIEQIVVFYKDGTFKHYYPGN